MVREKQDQRHSYYQRDVRFYLRPDGSSRRSSQNVSSTSVLLLASSDLALPDSDVGPLDGGLSTGGARVLGVLSDFHLLDAEMTFKKGSPSKPHVPQTDW